MLTAAVLCAVALVSALAPLISPYDPNAADPMNRLLPPSARHLLGTDSLGRDVFARILYGGRLSLVVGFAVALLSTIAGYMLGLCAALTRLDTFLMRVSDGLMAFPAVLLALGLVAAFGASPVNVVTALSLVYSPRVARLVRSTIVVVKTQPFVEAAVSLGAGMPRIVGKHIIPNTLSPVIVQATFTFAFTVQIEAALSFLGVGIPPDVPTWGNILQESRLVLKQAPWIPVAAGIAIMVVVLTLNILGDALRDYLDPKMRSVVS